MTDASKCPRNCRHGWLPCSSKECEAVMDGVGPVKSCPHCAGRGEPSRREDFHADL
jgi:hypothetical protein